MDSLSIKQLCAEATAWAFISNEGARLSNDLQRYIEYTLPYASAETTILLAKAREAITNLHYQYSFSSFQKQFLDPQNKVNG